MEAKTQYQTDAPPLTTEQWATIAMMDIAIKQIDTGAEAAIIGAENFDKAQCLSAAAYRMTVNIKEQKAAYLAQIALDKPPHLLYNDGDAGECVTNGD